MDRNNKKLWYIWILCALAACLMQAATIDVLPSLMQDEAQITDYGRLVLDPLSTWSVTWWVADNKPLFLWSYIGPLFAEIGYQLGGSSGIGPRVMALIGGLTAAMMALGWLKARKVPEVIAGLLAFSFLLDPLFTLSQRMARTDSWVITLCLASCWLLRLSASKFGKSKIILIMFSGMLATAGSFMWPSAVFLYPLICMELFHSIYEEGSIKRSLRNNGRLLLYFILAGLLVAVLLIIPVRQQMIIITDNMRNMVELNVNASKTPFERLFAIFSFQPWAKLIKAFAKTLSPFLPMLALWAFLFRREKGVVLAAIFTLLIIFTTLVYEFRVLYLLPYFLALSGDLFRRYENKTLHPNIRRLSAALLLLVVVWSIGVSIFLRSALAYGDGDLRKRNLISQAATSAIGPGNYKVFLAFTYEFYFTGRSLGWQLYTPYIQFSYDAEGNWIRQNDFQPKDKFLKLMSEMDYAIFPQNKINGDIGNQLALSGLSYCGTIHISDGANNKRYTSSSDRMNEIVIWFLRGAPFYGPYLLYARSEKKIISLNSQVRKAPK